MARIDRFDARRPHTIAVSNATLVRPREEATQSDHNGGIGLHECGPAAAPGYCIADGSIGIAERTGHAYSQAGEHYAAYADGDAHALFDFTGIHGYADACVWKRLDTALRQLRATGARSVSILDAGCGPGTWLRRMVIRARELGFTDVTAHGFDIARVQVRRARFLAHDLCQAPGVTMEFEVADLTSRLRLADGAFDITLCLFSVLSHLPAERLPRIAAEIARVTRGAFITTMRPVGSQPTVFVAPIEQARHFERDAKTDRFEVELSDGRHMVLGFHLFSAAELTLLFSAHFAIEELSGLDLFHSRFALDSRWNPPSCGGEDLLSERLARLEESFAGDPAFLDHATHLLLVGHRRQG